MTENPEAGKRTLDFQHLFDNSTFVKIFSVVIAVGLWFFVSLYISTETRRTISNVPLSVDTTGTATGALGLVPIGFENQTVDVVVYGSRLAISKLSAADFKAAISLSNVITPGDYILSVSVQNLSKYTFEIETVTQNTVDIHFDRMSEKKFTVQTENPPLSVSEGYLMQEPILSVKEITVKGPEAEVSKIEKCVARFEIKDKLSDTKKLDTNLLLLDSLGGSVISNFIEASDSTTEITIPVLKKKVIDLKFGYVNTPTGFPIESLNYTVSQTQLEVAGPSSIIDSLNEIIIGYVDFKKLDINSKFDFTIPLPNNVVSVEELDAVHLEFDFQQYSGKVMKVENISVINPPAAYDITVNTKVINNVTIYGPSSVIKGLTSSDIVAQIDMSTVNLTEGTSTLPVMIVIPGKGVVWAKGEYTVNVNIKKK